MPVPRIRCGLALIGQLLTLVGDAVTKIGQALTLDRVLAPCIGDEPRLGSSSTFGCRLPAC